MADVTGRRSNEIAAVFAQFAAQLVTFLRDKNAAALEKAVTLCNAFVDRADRQLVTHHAEAIAKALCDVGLGAKPSTKSAAQQLLLLLVEADAPEPTVETLLLACAHKTPKVRVAALETLVDTVKQFGVAPLPFKSILKTLPSFFNDSDNTFRALATTLAVELHRTLGEVVVQQLKDLRRSRNTAISLQLLLAVVL